MDGLLPSPEHLPSDAAFLDTRSRHATVRVWEPPPRVVEQAPKLPRFHSYRIGQACVLQFCVVAGLFLPASVHILSVTALLFVVSMHVTVRVRDPVPHVLLQPPQLPDVNAYTGQASRAQALLVAGFSAVHAESV